MKSEGRRPSKRKERCRWLYCLDLNEHALVVKVETTTYGIEDITLKFPEGEIVVMSRKTITEIFELVSEAP